MSDAAFDEPGPAVTLVVVVSEPLVDLRGVFLPALLFLGLILLQRALDARLFDGLRRLHRTFLRIEQDHDPRQQAQARIVRNHDADLAIVQFRRTMLQAVRDNEAGKPPPGFGIKASDYARYGSWERVVPKSTRQ